MGKGARAIEHVKLDNNEVTEYESQVKKHKTSSKTSTLKTKKYTVREWENERRYDELRGEELEYAKFVKEYTVEVNGGRDSVERRRDGPGTTEHLIQQLLKLQQTCEEDPEECNWNEWSSSIDIENPSTSTNCKGDGC